LGRDEIFDGTNAGNRQLEVSAPKNKKQARASESTSHRPKHGKQKLIRLDDLIPKQDVSGGYQLLFGVTDATSITNNPKQEN